MAKDLAREAAREMLEVAVSRFPGSIAALAKRAGVSPSTITRPLNSDDYSYVPKQATLEKIMRAAGVATPPFQATSYPMPWGSRQVPIMGVAIAGVWDEEPEAAVDDEYIVLPISEDDGPVAAYIVGSGAGGSFFKDGTVLVVHEEQGPKDGDYVVVRRIRDSLVETSFRLVEVDESVRKLWAPGRGERRDPSFLTDPGADDIIYMGVVIATFWHAKRA